MNALAAFSVFVSCGPVGKSPDRGDRDMRVVEHCAHPKSADLGVLFNYGAPLCDLRVTLRGGNGRLSRASRTLSGPRSFFPIPRQIGPLLTYISARLCFPQLHPLH